MIYIQPNIQTSEVFCSVSQLSGTLFYQLKKSSDVWLLERKWFCVSLVFLAVLPMHALTSLLTMSKKHLGTVFTSRDTLL